MTNAGTTLEPGNIVLIPFKEFGAVRADVFQQIMQAICKTIGCTPG